MITHYPLLYTSNLFYDKFYLYHKIFAGLRTDGRPRAAGPAPGSHAAQDLVLPASAGGAAHSTALTGPPQR